MFQVFFSSSKPLKWCPVSDIRMSLPPGQLGASRAAPASRVTATRMTATRNSVITSLRGLPAPAPPPVVTVESVEVTAQLDIPCEVNKSALVDGLRMVITEERRKRGKAEHEFMQMKKRLAEEKLMRSKTEKKLIEETLKNRALYDKVLQKTAFYKADIVKRESGWRRQLTQAKLEIQILKQKSLKAEVEQKIELEEYKEVWVEQFKKVEMEKLEVEFEQSKEVAEEQFEEDEIFHTPGMMSQHMEYALATKVPAVFTVVLPAPSTPASKFKIRKKDSKSKEEDVKEVNVEEVNVEEVNVEEVNVEEVNVEEVYKDTPDHIDIIRNLPKREEVFVNIDNRLSGPTNYKYLALLYNSTNGEETVEAFQLTRDTFRAKYGEDFEAAEKVAAAGPTGGRGQDKARDAVMSTRSDTWVRGITWMFNSLTDFVQDNPEFRYYTMVFHPIPPASFC